MLGLILSSCNGTAPQKWHLDVNIRAMCILQRLNRPAAVECKTIILGTDEQMVLLFLSTSELTKKNMWAFFPTLKMNLRVRTSICAHIIIYSLSLCYK